MRLIVIGGGAAGFFCAVTAARKNPAAEVILLEKTGKVLSKVRISGGGRCNVTHACFSIPEMIKRYPRGQHFVKKAFHQFFTEDTITWFKERGVLLKTEDDGRMFPVTDSSETIIHCLLKEADKYCVRVKMQAAVKRLERKDGRWSVHTETEVIEGVDGICLASGGYPKASMFDGLLPAGHTVVSPVPSLFTFNISGDPILALMGVTTHCRVKIKFQEEVPEQLKTILTRQKPKVKSKWEEEGPVLITHWGLSGPAILRLSAWAATDLAAVNYRFAVVLNWCPGLGEQQLRSLFMGNRSERGGQRVMGRNDLGLPQRLWEYLCKLSGIAETGRWADLTSVKQNELIRLLISQELKVGGKTTYKEEFVTAGGIRLSEVEPNTMGSRLAPGLYFAGEVLDVDGVTGGFNFQHAWTSGWIAGNHLGDR